MKISKSAESIQVSYEIETKLGSLECTFHHENVGDYFYSAFSPFAEDQEDFHSKSPTFEKYIDKALTIFAEVFPIRLGELIEETVEEVELRTLMETEKMSLSDARRAIVRAVRQTEQKKKERLNAPTAGRPKQWKSEELRQSITDIINGFKFSRQPTLADVAKRMDPPTNKDALTKLLKRHNLDWKVLRKRT